MVKITAYDFTIYGGLHGKVEQISADSIQDEEGNSFYLVRVRTEKSYLGDELNTSHHPRYVSQCRYYYW